MTQFEVSTNHTPAFVREFCTQKFMVFTSILDEIILGGLKLAPEAIEALKKRGQAVVGDIAVATIRERLSAIEMYGKFGPGIRVDARGEDGPPRRSVVEMPPWEDAEFEDVTPKGELLRGDNGDEPEESA